MKKLKVFMKLACENFTTLFAIIAFIMIYTTLFGDENSLIGVGIVTALLFFKDIDLGVKRKHGALLVFLFLNASVFMPYFATYNVYLGLVINFFSIFYMTLLTSEKIDYKAYLGFVLLYVLAEGNPVYGEALTLRLLSSVLFSVLIMIVYFVKHKNDTHYKGILTVKRESHIEHISFALKLAFSLSVAMFLADFFDIHKHMWFTITVMSITQVDIGATLLRMRHRVLYTLLGSLIYIIVFGMILPHEVIVYVALALSFCYTFVKKYNIQMIFITINSLIANEIYFGSDLQAVLSRVILMASGVVFAYAMTKIDFIRIYQRIKKE